MNTAIGRNTAFLARMTLLASVVAPAAPAAIDEAAIRPDVAEDISRCTTLADLTSCHAALGVKGNDPALLIGEADALVLLNRPGEAIGVYRNALKSGAGADAVHPRIARAQARRQSLLATCEQEGGAAGLRACDSAWLPGAPDEVTVFKRRGLLMQKEDDVPGALEAYRAAARLAPRDRGVARAIVALTGDLEGADAATLMARGAALMTLGRPRDAIAPLRQALQLAPDLAEAGTRLNVAQRAHTPRPRRHASTRRHAPQAVPVAAASNFTNDAPATRSN